MENFSEVSLGFAEFVSQLLRETFDATLSAQNHQLEQYVELTNSLNLSNERFSELYLDEETIKEREQSLFNAPLHPQMELTKEQQKIANAIAGETKGVVHQGKLTKNGYALVKNALLERLVNEKKEALQALLNSSEMTRLVVDSGEIKAKLELTNLSKDTSEEVTRPSQKTARVSKKTAKKVAKKNVKQLEANAVLLSSKVVAGEGVRLREIVNAETQRKTLIVDTSSVKENAAPQLKLPPVRVIAKPASTTSNSSLLSEVTIRFKTV